MKQLYRFGLGSLLVLVGSAQQFFVNDFLLTAVLATALLGLLFRLFSDKRSRIASLVLTALGWLGVLVNSWTATSLAGLGLVAWGLILLSRSAIALGREKSALWKQVLAYAWLLVNLLPAGVTGLMTLATTATLGLIGDQLMPAQVATDVQQSQGTAPDGSALVSNIQYDDKVENGYLDIYYSQKAESDKPLTVVFIHGGGYMWGDKVGGDPNAGQSLFANTLVGQMLDEGYNVVSMNYALVPEAPFPIAIKQLNRGLAYLKTHAEELGLNMNQVVLSGGSAGGNLAGVLANLQTNPAYAKELGEAPSLAATDLTAVVFQSSLLDNARFGQTQSAVVDWMYYSMGRLYLKANDLHRAPTLALSNVTDNVTENFPPTFISDGNSGSFSDQAFDLADKLADLGVRHQLIFFAKEEAGILQHGFEEHGNAYSKKTLEETKAFLRSLGN